jgi:DNA polymerase
MSHRVSSPDQTAVQPEPFRGIPAGFIVLDAETRSLTDLRKVGAWPYTTAPSTEVLCVACAINDAPVTLWLPGEPVPVAIIQAAADPATLWIAHNAAFELALWEHILAPKHGWPEIPPPQRWRCTMTECLALALPAALKDVADVLALAHRKADDRIMHTMTKPRLPRGDEDPNGVYWFDDAEHREALFAYCRADVECERDLWRWLSC